MQFYHSRARDSDAHAQKAEMRLEISHRHIFDIAYVMLSIAKVNLDVIYERTSARSHRSARDERSDERKQEREILLFARRAELSRVHR